VRGVLRLAWLAPLALLAACGDAPARREAAAEPTPTGSPASPASIAGEWQVMAVDSLPFTDGSGPRLRIGAERIDFENCQRIGWSYKLQGGRITTERSPQPAPEGGGNAEPCEPLPIPVLQMVSAIDSLRRVAHAPDGRLRLTGGPRSLELASP
jgi:hypothetical protein